MLALSLGAGVQSSTMLMMAHEGLIPRPIFAVFADTKDEPVEVYTNLQWLRDNCSIPIFQVDLGVSITEQAIENKDGGRFISLPLFGERGPFVRQCTPEFKIYPVRRLMRRAMKAVGIRNLAPDSAQLQMGISMDEIHRQKPSGVKWLTHTYPLIDLNMTRQDCLQWMASRGYPLPPRSSCITCPYHSDDHWRRMKRDRPADFEHACQFDEAMRNVGKLGTVAHLHRSRVPLREIDFGVIDPKEDMYDECGGYCHL